jgi:nucleoid DNA-binding protein
MDKQLADLILRTIFSKIVEGVKSDGRVVINGFGRFVKRKRHRVWRKFNPYVGAGKIIPGGRIAVKPTNTLAFEACKRFRRSMRDEEQDA